MILIVINQHIQYVQYAVQVLYLYTVPVYCTCILYLYLYLYLKCQILDSDPKPCCRTYGFGWFSHFCMVWLTKREMGIGQVPYMVQVRSHIWYHQNTIRTIRMGKLKSWI